MTENDEFLRFTLPVSTARHKNQTSLKPLVTYTLVSLNLFPLEISSPPTTVEISFRMVACQTKMLRDASVWVDYFQSKRIPVAFARWHSFIVFKLKNNGKFHRESATAIHLCEKMNPPDAFLLQKNRLHEKKYQLPRDFLGTPTWPPFYNCFGTSLWLP